MATPKFWTGFVGKAFAETVCGMHHRNQKMRRRTSGVGGNVASRQAVASRRKAVWKLLGLFMLDGWEAADNVMLADLNGLLQGREINGDAWHGEFQRVVKRYLKKDRQIDF